MIEETISLNAPQMASLVSCPKSEVDIWGRGTGKSFKVGWTVNNIIRKMPRSITAITGQTYGQLLTRTLPSTFKFLEKLGFRQYDPKTGGNYVIGKKPPASFITPYEPVLKHDNFISFANGTGFTLFSQERVGSARGPNVDFEIVDEALTINHDRYDQETSPTNRGNNEIFGSKSPSPVYFHHGFLYVSSMPFLPEQKWLLNFGQYYETEFGINIFEIWNRIVKLQLELISAAKIQNASLFREIWNECNRLKLQIIPIASSSGILFSLANAFDNINVLGMKYILGEYDKQTLLTFMIEILNWIIDRIENCYYHLDTSRHIYYNALNEPFIRTLAEQTNFDFSVLQNHDSRFDLDCDPNRPLEIVPDWGAKISLFSIAQERSFNFVNQIIEPVDCTINEFFEKPGDNPGVIIDNLVDQICKYYQPHVRKEIIYFRDRYGDHRQPNAKNSKPYNEQAIDRFIHHGWSVQTKVHKGMEPPQHEKYLLWLNILQGNNPTYPKVIFNGKKCKYTLISMNNTELREKDGKFEKNKSSESRKSVLPEEATHFGDAVDKRIWTKYGHLITRSSSTFIDPRGI